MMKVLYSVVTTGLQDLTTGFVLKTKYDTNKSYLEKKINGAEKKIPDTNSLVKKSRL